MYIFNWSFILYKHIFCLVRSDSLDVTLVNEVSTVRDGSKTYLKCVIDGIDLGYDPFKRVFDTGCLEVQR